MSGYSMVHRRVQWGDVKPLIYVIDDDPLICDLVALHLSDFEVRFVHSGWEGLLDLTQLSPTLILLDIDMPGMTGHDVLEILRSRPACATTPIMMLTAADGVEAVQATVAAGATAYMLKPFTRQQLLSRVRRLTRTAEVSW